MALTKELEQFKLYAKIDHYYDDDLILEMIESAKLTICDAISWNAKPDDFKDDARFSLAVKKQAKEDYEHRGLSADSKRHSLANGVLPIIQQLRFRGGADEN